VSKLSMIQSTLSGMRSTFHLQLGTQQVSGKVEPTILILDQYNQVVAGLILHLIVG